LRENTKEKGLQQVNEMPGLPRNVSAEELLKW